MKDLKNNNLSDLINCKMYDKARIITNCVVEIWKNTFTGEESVGWYTTEDSEEIETL